MTAPSRREKLEAMLADDPNDTFLQYGLAMEFDKEGSHDQSLDLLGQLMTGDPPYVPAFFMAGQQLTKINRLDEARQALGNGIEEAKRQGDSHAAGEMSEFLMGLG